MKNLYNKLSLFSVLALVAFEPKNLQATSSRSEELQDSQKSPISFSFKFVQGTVQRIQKGHFVREEVFNACVEIPEDIKQFGSMITFDNPLFDSWITLILKTLPTDPAFENVLKIAQTRGESDWATPIAQYNLGLMYDDGYGVERNSDTASKFYGKAADRGHADAQYQFGRYIAEFSNDMKEDNESYVKGYKYYKKAAKQGHPMAQDFLAYMYRSGRGVDKDLVQSLKWYLESYKNNHPDPSDYPKNFINFIPSTITLEDEKKHIADQNSLKDNIECFLRIHDLETGVFNHESEFEIPSLVETYSKIINFEEILLKAVKSLGQSGFMVTCLQPEDVDAFKASHCPDIKCHELKKGKVFLTFGQDNIKIVDNLMQVFDQGHPVYRAISDILRVSISQLEINRLKKLLDVPQQLQDLLIEGAPVRNKLFLQNNEYIKTYLKD